MVSLKNIINYKYSLSDIYNHKFNKLIIKKGEYFYTVMEKNPDIFKKDFTKNSYHLLYIVRIGIALDDIAGSLILLEQIKMFLFNYNIKKEDVLPFGINLDLYMRYHCSNHTLVLCSILEQILYLINCVFMFGLREKDCKLETIKNNYWIKHYDIDTSLNEIEKNINKRRQESNKYRHSGKLRSLDNLFDKKDTFDITGIRQDNTKSIKIDEILSSIFEDEYKLIMPLLNIYGILEKVFLKWEKSIKNQTFMY